MTHPGKCLVVAIAVATGLGMQGAPTESLPRLPRPNTSNLLPTVRQQLEDAYKSAELNSTSAEASGKLGMVFDAYEQYESAAVCYRRAHLLEPGSFRWLFYLGWVQAAQGMHEDAVRTLREAIRMNPDYVPARLALADSLFSIGNWEESQDIYLAISEAHPDNAEAHYGLGRARAARGDLAGARSSYVKSCELFPAYGAAHYELAMVHRKLGDAVQAQREFSVYEQNKGTAPPRQDSLRSDVTRLNLGSVARIRRGADLEQAGRIDEAIAAQEEALHLDPGAVQAHINLISLYGRLGQYDKATDHYKAALDQGGKRADLHYNYGVLLLRLGSRDEAEAAFERALQINPYYAEAHTNLGTLYEQHGRLNDALQQFTAALENRPDDRLAHFHLGRILANQDRYDEAIRHFLQIVTPEDEDTPRYLYAAAATYARAGDLPNALKYARMARDRAAALGQTQLLASIEKDLAALEDAAKSRKQ